MSGYQRASSALSRKKLARHGLAVEALAQKDGVGFGEEGEAVLVGQGQARMGQLIPIPAGGGAQIVVVASAAAVQHADGEAAVFVQQLPGEALGDG